MLADNLKILLASVNSLSIKVQYFHWNVEGDNFPQYHDFFGNLYEEIYTKEISFKKERYIKTNSIIFKDDKFEELSFYWSKLVGNKFKVLLNENNRIFLILTILLNLKELKNNENADINVYSVKNKLVQYIKNIILKKYKNIQSSESNIIDKYSQSSNKLFKNIDSIEILYNSILNDNYEGSEIDLEFISRLYKINFIIINKRIKKNNISYKTIITNNDYYFVLLYKSIVFETNVYNLIQYKNKILFRLNQLPEKFSDFVGINNK
jgi:hypothetical protein